MNNFLKKKLGKKGFSLVELIIVVAIMAALVAVLAPQYIKYVEKSRVTADENTITELASAIKVACVDESYTIATGASVALNHTGASTTNTTLDSALDEYYGTNWTTAKLKSTTYTTATITVTITNGTYTVDWTHT